MVDNNNNIDLFLKSQEELYAQGLYREIFDAAQANYGAYHTWGEPSLIRFASRCLMHMGLDRTADAILYRAWRKYPNHPDLAAIYLGVIKRRRGVLLAWTLSKQLLTLDLSDEQRSDVLVEQADIVSTFRDFSFAEKLILKASEISDDLWVKYNKGYLLFCQDRYDDAQEVLASVIAIRNDYRPARQMLSHILQLKGQSQRAIENLQEIAKTMQSVSLMQQLLYLYIEIKDYVRAAECLTRLEALFYTKNKHVIRQINDIKADLLCAQHKYEEALPYFEQKNLYHRIISESIKKNTESVGRNVLDVPFVRQRYMTCAPASITALAGYWGVELDQEKVIEDICYDGTPAVDERRWIESQGWYAIEFELNLETIKQLIDMKMPVLLATVEPGSAHLQIIVGYDSKLGIYILRDPYHPRLQEMLIKESHSYYASSGPRCLLMLPMEKAVKITGIEFKASALYDKYYQVSLALDNNSRQEAYEAYRLMLGIDKEHRLTLEAQRNLAIYDGDEPKTLSVTEELLSRFPDDVNFQLSKIASMAYMGSYQHTVEYIEMLCEKPMANFLLRSRLARELANDHRQQIRLRKLLYSLLKVRPTDVATLKIYADYLWGVNEFTLSYELYRFITCLEDKVESYATAYFNAARYFKETDLALDFLVDRFERFTLHSYGPAISLFNALESVDRTKEGFDYLEKALAMRPNDGFLMLFTARQYHYINQLERCLQLMAQARPLVNNLRYAELAVEVYESKNERQKAIKYCRTILAYDPLNHTINSTLVRLLNESGLELEATRFIDEQLLKFPGNYGLLRLQATNYDDSEIQQKEAAYRHLIDSHPDDNWAYKRLAHMLMQQYKFNDALELSLEATKIGSNDASAYCCLGDIYEAKADYVLAIEAYRRAIQISCDATDAYEPLLRCVNDKQEKKNQLKYIYDELLRQVTFGDALLEFQPIARRWYTTDELLSFLNFAVSERPDLWQSWVALVVENRDLELFDEAHKVVDRALIKFPLVPRLLYEKAEIYFYQHNLTDAELWLKKVLAMSPAWSTAITRLSVVLEYTDKKEEAIELLKDAINKSPYTVTPYGYLADLLWQTGHKQHAMETLKKVLEFTPLYSWAWDRLNEMCKQENQAAQVIESIEAQRKKMPDNADLVKIHVNLISDPEKKKQLLEAYLVNHKAAVGPSITLIHHLAEEGDYQGALAICTDTYWDGKMPMLIRANKAWVNYHMGNITDAITIMNKVVSSDPNYYDGWRFLADWYDELNDSVHVLQCIDECKRLYPNDANVLCFVAEHLQKHAKDQKAQVSELMKRSFYLNPTDRYIGLTYIDDLLADKLFEQAQSAIESLKRHVNDIYVISRDLSYACKTGQLEVAMTHWQYLIIDPDLTDNLLAYAWTLLSEAGYLQHAFELIDSQRRTDLASHNSNMPGICGKYWIQYLISEKGIADVIKSIRTISAQGEFDDRAFEGILRHLINEEIGVPEIFIKKHYKNLQEDRVNQGLVAYLYATSSKWHEVLDWLKGVSDRDDVDAWVLYFYGLAFRQTTAWESGIQMTAHALKYPKDNYYDELLIWYTFDAYIDGNIIMSRDELYEQINFDDLSNLSRFILSLSESLLCLQGRSFIDAYNDISPKLRSCQRSFQDISGHVAANIARQKTRDYLERTITGSLLTKMRWKWRLSNHF